MEWVVVGCWSALVLVGYFCFLLVLVDSCWLLAMCACSYWMLVAVGGVGVVPCCWLFWVGCPLLVVIGCGWLLLVTVGCC